MNLTQVLHPADNTIGVWKFDRLSDDGREARFTRVSNGAITTISVRRLREAEQSGLITVDAKEGTITWNTAKFPKATYTA